MDFRKELASYGYNKGNSIDVEILIDEILPEIFSKMYNKKQIRKIYDKSCGLIRLDLLKDQTENNNRFNKILKSITI